jgi:ribonuclease BN (tRNA processing enzyme)
MADSLAWDVFVSAQIQAVVTDLPPGATEMRWSPISSTLISGERDAVFIDTAITVEQNLKLADWIAASGKNLTTIYATHGHGDHFFGVNTIRQRFPNARFVATREVIAAMQKQASDPVVNAYWNVRFPEQIDSTLVIADELKEVTLTDIDAVRFLVAAERDGIVPAALCAVHSRNGSRESPGEAKRANNLRKEHLCRPNRVSSSATGSGQMAQASAR